MRRASKAAGLPVAPRLPAAHALRRLDDAALEDDAVYTDVEIAGRVRGRAARKMTFERVVLRDVDLTATRLDKLTLRDVRLSNCDLANAAWREAALDRVEVVGCRLTGLDLAEATANSLVVRDCSGTLASFRFATLKRSAFERCGLTEIDFQNAALVESVLRGCDLTGAVCFGASPGSSSERSRTIPSDIIPKLPWRKTR